VAYQRSTDYRIQVVDVYAIPQNGTGVSIEAVDEVFQQQMKDLIEFRGQREDDDGWYHSHPNHERP
jgi:26S proteasome regulatory subunit N11